MACGSRTAARRGRVSAWKKKLRILVACLTLEVGVVFGVPMRPDEIRELMHQMNQPKLAHVLKDEDQAGDGEGEGEQPPAASTPSP